MIEHVLQAPGRFDLPLAQPPDTIRRLTERGYALLIVTPAWMGPAETLTKAGLLAAASFAGIHVGLSDDRTVFSGYGPAWLLTLAKATASASVTSRPLYDGSNTSWIRNNILRTGSSEQNGITVGTIASSSSPAKTGQVKAGASSLSILVDVCRRFGVQFRFNPPGTLDVGSQATLWPSTTAPTVMATPIGGGRDLNIVGVPAVTFDRAADWDDYTTTVTVVDNDESHTGTDTLGSVPYVNPFDTTAIVSRRVVTSSTSDTDADCATVAARLLGRFDDVHQDITIDTDAYNISGDVQAGDTIMVYDPDNGLYDLTNEQVFAGRRLHPAEIRVREVHDACSADKGYYLASWNGSAQELHDLTPFVDFEPAGVSLKLGSPRRSRPLTPTTI